MKSIKQHKKILLISLVFFGIISVYYAVNSINKYRQGHSLENQPNPSMDNSLLNSEYIQHTKILEQNDLAESKIDNAENIIDNNQEITIKNIPTTESNKPKQPSPEVKNQNADTSNSKIVYLTFDDGPSLNTAKILDILKAFNIKATFFVIGNSTDFGKSMYKRIANEGHAIGNHTFSHRYDILYKSIDNYIAETQKLEKLIQNTTGVKPSIIRFPGGSNNTISNKYADKSLMIKLSAKMQEKGYQYFDWNVSSRDMEPPNQTCSVIIQSTLQGVYNNKQPSIVLLHDSPQNNTTAQALPEIIKSLNNKGYQFKALSKLSYCYHFELQNQK